MRPTCVPLYRSGLSRDAAKFAGRGVMRNKKTEHTLAAAVAWPNSTWPTSTELAILSALFRPPLPRDLSTEDRARRSRSVPSCLLKTKRTKNSTTITGRLPRGITGADATIGRRWSLLRPRRRRPRPLLRLLLLLRRRRSRRGARARPRPSPPPRRPRIPRRRLRRRPRCRRC